MKLYSSDKDRIFKGKQRFEDLYNWCRIGECMIKWEVEPEPVGVVLRRDREGPNVNKVRAYLELCCAAACA